MKSDTLAQFRLGGRGSASRGAQAASLSGGAGSSAAIVCDMMMPELSGMEVFDALDRDLREQRDRMSFMTGGALSELAQRFLAARSDSYLRKTVPRAALEAAVQAVVTRPRP